MSDYNVALQINPLVLIYRSSGLSFTTVASRKNQLAGIRGAHDPTGRVNRNAVVGRLVRFRRLAATRHSRVHVVGNFHFHRSCRNAARGAGGPARCAAENAVMHAWVCAHGARGYLGVTNTNTISIIVMYYFL